MNENTQFCGVFRNLCLPQHGEKQNRQKMIVWNSKAQPQHPGEFQATVPMLLLPILLLKLSHKGRSGASLCVLGDRGGGPGMCLPGDTSVLCFFHGIIFKTLRMIMSHFLSYNVLRVWRDRSVGHEGLNLDH